MSSFFQKPLFTSPPPETLKRVAIALPALAVVAYSIPDFLTWTRLTRFSRWNPIVILQYTVFKLLHPFGGETLSTTMYLSPNEKIRCGKAGLAGKGWLEGLEPRKDDRPRVTNEWVGPQRQLAQLGSDKEVKETFLSNFHAIQSNSPNIFTIKRSGYERQTDALFLVKSYERPHDIAVMTAGEIAHIHAGTAADGSMHVMLSPVDATTVLKMGWGERHWMANGWFLPKEYIFVYAPRTLEEVEVVTRILKAGVSFMTGEKF